MLYLLLDLRIELWSQCPELGGYEGLLMIIKTFVRSSNLFLLSSPHNKLLIRIFSSNSQCYDLQYGHDNPIVKMGHIQEIVETIKSKGEEKIYKQSHQIPQILSKTLFLINKRKDENSSIFFLIPPQFNCSPQYKGMMNCIFSCRDQNIIVDVMSMYGEEGILQQLSFMSGGVYISPKEGTQIGTFLEYVFGVDPSIRRTLSLPEPSSIDLRPDCFCHATSISDGFVCSVCLGIFCKFIPICPICRTKFDFKKRLNK